MGRNWTRELPLFFPSRSVSRHYKLSIVGSGMPFDKKILGGRAAVPGEKKILCAKGNEP
jgi:hypothetical protein